LIIAMVMLVIIAIMSVAVMRNATSAEQTTTNNRLQTQATQGAQMALRYCEEQARLANPGTPPITPAPNPPAWTQKGNWTSGGAGKAHTLQQADVPGGAANFPAAPPQCISELAPGNTPYLYTVTARGFSPDYREDPRTHATVTGSVIWLQSTIYAPP
jgi:Tfp pilus assembly protein PilX